MNFKCKVSKSDDFCAQTFSSIPKIVEHFKVFHGLKEGVSEFPCVVNNNCSKQFLTISGLKNHARKCVPLWYVCNIKFGLKKTLLNFQFLFSIRLVVNKLIRLNQHQLHQHVWRILLK